MLIATTVANQSPVPKILEPCHPVSCIAAIMTFLLSDSNHSYFFVNHLNFQVVSIDQARLSLWASQQEMFLQSWGCQLHAPIPNLEDQGLFC